MADYAIGAKFIAKIDGLPDLPVQEHTPITHEINKVEIKRQLKDGKYELTNVPGTHKPQEVTFTFIFREECKPLLAWFAEASKGSPTAYKTAVIESLSTDGKKKIEVHNLHKVIPKSIEFGNLKAGDTNALTLKVTCVHHGAMEELSKLGESILAG